MESPIEVTRTYNLYRFDQLSSLSQRRAIEQFIHQDNITIEDNSYSLVEVFSYACTMMEYINKKNIPTIMIRIMGEKPLFFRNGTIVDQTMIELLPLSEIKPSWINVDT